MLSILKNTKLGYIYEQEPFEILTREQYIDMVRENEE